MRSLGLCGFSRHVVEAMKRVSAAGNRSMQAQGKLNCNRGLPPAQTDLLDRAADWRQRLARRELSSVVAALREDRGR